MIFDGSRTVWASLSPALPQLCSAALAGGIALAVSVATNRSNTARLREQFQLERQAATATNRRSKGEELFVLLHFWASNVSGHTINIGMAMQGKLSYNQVLDADIENSRQFASKYEAPRIELYIRSYFPASIELHSQLIASLRDLNKMDSEFKHAYERGETDLTRFSDKNVRLQMGFEHHLHALQQKIVEELRGV